MNELQIFNNTEFGEIRTFEINGQPYFVANDIARVLGYVETAKAIRTHCKGVSEMDIPSNGGIQTMKVIPEGDIYRLIIRSKLPEAEKFESWIFDEVIPQIRKTGGYNLPQTLPEALRAYALEIEAKEKLAAENKLLIEKNAELEPKGIFYDTVTQSDATTSMADVAKILDMGVGRNKLFSILKDRKILQPDNKPYQKYIDAGYFKLVEEKYNKGDGTGIYYKTVAKQKGIDFIRKILLEELT